MIELTALLLTFNEEENIRRTLAALTWAPRVLVIDSYSTDRTVELVGAFPNAAVLQRSFDTHAQQWNFGLQQVQSEWVLALDADYILSAELATEIQRLNPAPAVAGYRASFIYQIHGRSLRHSAYPPHVVLFRRDRGTYYDEGHTQKLRLDGEVADLDGVIYHDDRKPLSRWIRSQNQYAKLEAKHLLNAGAHVISIQDRLRLTIYFAPVVMFLYLLFGRLLILDGWAGWYYVMQRTIAEMLLSLRLLTEREKFEEE